MEPEPPKNEKGTIKDSPVGNVGEQIDFLKYLTYGLITVLAVAFVTLILNYFSSSQSAYQNLANQVIAQNSKIETLMNIDTQILLQQQGKTKVIYLPAPSANQ